MRTHKTLGPALLLGLAASLPLQAADSSERELLERVRTGELASRAGEQEKMAAFRSASPSERSRLADEARQKRDALRATSETLERTARDNDQRFKEKVGQLRAQMGPNATLFGTLTQLSTDLVGLFRNSPTSLQYPDREAWLTDFIGRMERSSQIFSVEQLEKLWFLVQQEITASGEIVRVEAEVLGESGERARRSIVRVGKFVLVTDDPEPAYLAWQAEVQRASTLKRQPEGDFLDEIEDYVEGDEPVAALGIDPTGGSLLTRLVDSPSLGDQIEAGGLIGNLILLLGVVGAAIAGFKLYTISVVGAKVAAQRRNLARPSDDNPLGRMLKVYEDNKQGDTETLEMRLGEAILAERPQIDRYINSIKVISAVAPLMGLMGTVIGMIATFQAITLFGTGDPKTMAGGISQALVTTVEGLTVAIPMVLLYAVVNARAASLINTLKHQTAGLIAERMEARAQGQA